MFATRSSVGKKAANAKLKGNCTDYIHRASKFATSANIGNKAAYHIHWPSKLATVLINVPAKQEHN